MYSKIALSIGGSDSGGGAGIQADLRTFMALKVHGCTALTCVTAQNSVGVTSVEALNNNILASQIDTLFNDFEISALKTGMLLNEKIIKKTSEKIGDYPIPKIIDPVMVSRTGSKLLEENAINAYKELLFPQAELITPNIYEANLITNLEIKNKNDVEKAAEFIISMGVKAVLIKGGGLNILKGQDFYIERSSYKEWLTNKFINTKNTHGSGCTLSAAICGYRAIGVPLIDSIKKAKIFIEKSLKNSYKVGAGPGPLGHQ